ncbi:MAG: hypothetical protein ACE5JA_05155 [bacterium]
MDTRQEFSGGKEGSGAAGLTYKKKTGKPNIHGQVEGDPPKAKLNKLDLEIPAVFGVSKQELKTMADYLVDHVDDLPSPMPDMSFTYIDGNATFNSNRPLIGGGLLVVDGNMTIAANSFSDFAGVIYVTGNYTGNAPMILSGTVVVRGHVYMSGGVDVSEVVYNASVIETVMQNIGQYRECKTVHVPNRG